MVYALEIVIRNMREEMKVQGRAEGKVEGKAEGRAEGERNAKIEVAKKLFAIDMDIKQISYITGFIEDEIRRLG